MDLVGLVSLMGEGKGGETRVVWKRMKLYMPLMG